MTRKKISISDVDAWRMFKLLEECNAFLHQPANFDEHEGVLSWLKGGVYRELSSLLYNVTATWFAPDKDGNVIPPEGIAGIRTAATKRERDTRISQRRKRAALVPERARKSGGQKPIPAKARKR